jgi:hypothetical protein
LIIKIFTLDWYFTLQLWRILKTISRSLWPAIRLSDRAVPSTVSFLLYLHLCLASLCSYYLFVHVLTFSSVWDPSRWSYYLCLHDLSLSSIYSRELSSHCIRCLDIHSDRRIGRFSQRYYLNSIPGNVLNIIIHMKEYIC